MGQNPHGTFTAPPALLAKRALPEMVEGRWLAQRSLLGKAEVNHQQSSGRRVTRGLPGRWGGMGGPWGLVEEKPKQERKGSIVRLHEMMRSHVPDEAFTMGLTS